MQEFILDYTYKNKKWSFITYAKDINEVHERISAIKETLHYQDKLEFVPEDPFRHIKLRYHVCVNYVANLFLKIGNKL